MTPPFKLRHTNLWNSVTFFANLGGFWGPGDTRRLIERVVEKPENARVFDTVEEARDVLVLSDNLNSKHWQIIDAEGKPVK